MTWLSYVISNVALASILALIAFVVQHGLRSPAVGRVLWLLALLKLITPPVVSVPLSESPGALACFLGTCACGAHVNSEGAWRAILPWILLAVWSGGSGLTAWIAWRRWARFKQLLKHAAPASSEWQALAAQLAGELGLRGAPQILVIPGRLPPLVIPGWRRPLLLLPKAMLAQLGQAQRSALLLHELVHLKNGDHLVRLFELIVGIVFWWLPIVRSIGRQLRDCEESRCDAAVVAHLPQARRDYAQLLLDVLDFARPLPQSALAHVTAMSFANTLEQRLRAILVVRPKVHRNRPALAAALVLACAVLPCELRYGLVGGTAPPEQQAISSAAAEPRTATAGAGVRGLSNLIPADPASAPNFVLRSMCCPSS